jgi:F0F1-type ATP synthase assembly protein I
VASSSRDESGHSGWLAAAREDRSGSDVSAEFLAAALTCGVGGWLLDEWLATAPWLLIVGLGVGHAAGLYLLWLRSVNPATRSAAEPRQGSDPADVDGEPSTNSAKDQV